MTDKFPCFLGIDAGSTALKAVVFDGAGNALGSGQSTCEYSYPKPHWVERDMNEIWASVCTAIKKAIQNSPIESNQIKAVSVTGHGDGVYLVDQSGKPVRPGIPSIDTRAADVAEDLNAHSDVNEILNFTGQGVFIFTPAVLLAWIKKHEKENYDRIGYVLSCKDWIRYKLTNEFCTDFTESSTSFTNVRTQKVDRKNFELFGIEELADHFPQVKLSIEQAGKITGKAALETGLEKGTVVSAGLHDLDATAVGIGCTNPGQLEIIAGTWSINQIILDHFNIDSKLMCRNFLTPGQWTSLTGSPASATNLEWFVNQLCQDEVAAAAEENISKFSFVDKAIAGQISKPSDIFFLPFMYGSPYSQKASAGFLGIKGWHTRPDLLVAVYEGVVFNHLVHVNWLKASSTFHEIRLTGGGAKSRLWSQLFADAIGEPVITTLVSESGTLGSAICAAIAADYYPNISTAVAAMVKTKDTFEPSPERHAYLQEKYSRYEAIISALSPIWEKEK